MHTCIHACIHANMHTCIHAYRHTCIHAYMQTTRTPRGLFESRFQPAARLRDRVAQQPHIAFKNGRWELGDTTCLTLLV